MTFVVNDIGFKTFCNSVGGPVVRYLRSKGEAVNSTAYTNASGEVLGVKTSNLRDHIGSGRAPKIVLADPPYAEVGSTWTKEGFSYGWYHDANRRPWLTNAVLSNGFRRS